MLDPCTASRRPTVAPAIMLALMALVGCQAATTPAAPSADAREAIELPADELAHLRTGMRAYLEAAHAISYALAHDRMRQVAEKAREVGTRSIQGVPLAAAARLPPQFTLLALDTHQRFDTLAQAASGAASRTDILQKLSDIFANCTACHATYRVVGR